tara:strand:- start:1115 stop:1876 length:762 start_codon:yes stop_codon:yes gene_type:complete
MINKIVNLIKRSFKTTFITLATIYIIGSLPFQVKETTLVNPETNQTIVFQETVHYAELSFFNIINSRKDNYINEGFTHFYEQVNFTTEDMKKFESKLGYAKEVSRLFTKVDLKSEMTHLKKDNAGSVRADVDSKELLSKIKSEATYNNTVINERIKEEVLKIDSNLEKHFVRTLMKTSLKLNLFLQELDIYLINEDFKNSVIDFRNKELVYKMISSDKNIYVTYGALHAKGVIDILKELGFEEKESISLVGIR